MENLSVNAAINEMTAPISEDRPCGENFSFSPEFDRVQEARREDDPTLDYGEWTTSLKQADWKAVVSECKVLLKEKTKDIRVAAWLTEGLVKTTGFAGLEEGLEITCQLLKNFGADVHPCVEDGDDEQRIGTTSWLIQRAAYLVRCTAITDSSVGRYSLMDYESAVSLHLQLQRHPGSVPNVEQRVTLEDFSNAIAGTDRLHFSTQLGIIERCYILVQTLSDCIDTLLGLGAPSIKPLLESVDAVQARLRSICKGLGMLEAGVASTGVSTHASSTRSEVIVESMGDVPGARDVSLSHHLSLNGIGSRAEAVEVLRQVASYFRAAEPHSPVAYLAEKALHWSEMPLHVWLRSVVKDPGVLSHLEEMLGAEASGRPSND